ncbi:MAG: hypothetical protein ABIE74_12885 [Pseudomonadota bacterium]
MKKVVILHSIISDGRIDNILNLINLSKNDTDERKEIRLDWSKVRDISPAGLAILSCLFDNFAEQKMRVTNIHIAKKLLCYPTIQHFKNIQQYTCIPNPSVHDYEDTMMILRGRQGSLYPFFTEHIFGKFSTLCSEELLYDASLIINELMQNSVDHSTSERYYLYAGIWGKEFHVGVLDMGITVPAKLEQKYKCDDDLAYLNLALKKGSSTRRVRPGGLGLNYFFELLKNSGGKLTIVSRGAQIRRYFTTRRSQKNILKYPLSGTWCFARFPLED